MSNNSFYFRLQEWKRMLIYSYFVGIDYISFVAFAFSTYVSKIMIATSSHLAAL